MPTIWPNWPSATRSMATFANVEATIWSRGSGWPGRGGEGRAGGGEGGRKPGVPAEDPEAPDPLVAAEGRPLPVDELLGPGDRGREADAVLGAGGVVVHRLGNGHEGHALRREHPREREGVVAADRDEDVDAELVEMLHDERREIEPIFAAL